MLPALGLGGSSGNANHTTHTSWGFGINEARPEGIYVLHCFQKKTQKTSRQDLDLAARRFKAIQVKV
jgi:hypothetical protein